MCGIVGYLGNNQATPVLLSKLRCLEYRGYDSAGVAVIEGDRLNIIKSAGKLSNLETLLQQQRPSSTIGIGHTRWATHGSPTNENAHPHTDSTGTFAVVHNGIIENYAQLRCELIEQGYVFTTETDTEVTVHLLSREYEKDQDILGAIVRTVNVMKGAFALGIVSLKHRDRIYAVNHHYSLTVGLGENESFLASDSTAVRQYTNKIVRLEQSEIAEIKTNSYRLFSFDGTETFREPVSLNTEPYKIDKEGFKHFLLKEINEQPLVLRQTMSKYLPVFSSNPKAPISFNVERFSADASEGVYGVKMTDNEIKSIKRIIIVACGTALNAGMVGKLIIEELCSIPVEVEIASEIQTRNILADESTLVIAVSQSGETADTLAAIKAAKAKGAYTLGITNRPDSHLAQIASNLIVTECGIEVSVAATKTYVAQLMCFYLLGIYLGEKRGSINGEQALEMKKTLHSMPALMEQILAREEEYKNLSLKLADASDVVFIARGVNYPTALEGALKLKELSYIHASGYAAGELKHGPIAVLDSAVPVITVLVPGKVYEKTLSNAQESRARNARMVAVACDGDEMACETFDYIFRIPPVEELFSPLVTIVPLQLMSYFVADYLGKDVDQPRNLAKSVTVE